MVNRGNLEHKMQLVIKQCIMATMGLVKELERHFLAQDFTNAIRFFYP
jgi:hypothetical protein